MTDVKVKSLLIVDDDASTLCLLTANFEAEYRVTVAANGLVGLKMAQTQRPDIVILDGKLPGLDGLAVLAVIKADPTLSHTVVVMITGRGQLTDLEKGVLMGADAYFIKPVSPASLRNWLLKNPTPNSKVDPKPAKEPRVMFEEPPINPLPEITPPADW